MVADRFRLRYKLTPEHFQAYAKLTGKRVKGARSWKNMIGILLAGLLTGVLLVGLQQADILQQREIRIAIGAGAFGAMMTLALYAFIYAGLMRRMVGAHDAVIGEFSLAAYDGGGLQITGKHMQSSFDWTAFIDLTQTADIVVIWVDTGVGVILPDSAFADDAEQQQFVEFVKERIEAFKTKPADD